MRAKCLGAGLGIVQAAQRIPAGMEFGVGGIGGAFGGMRGNDPVGGLHVALVDQFARQHAALDPPGIGIDQRGAVRRRLQHDRGGVRKLLLLAQIFGLREDIAGRTLRGRHGLQQLGRVLVATEAAAQASASGCAPARLGHPLRRIHPVGIEHPLHAETVVGGRDDGAEFLDDRRLSFGFQLLGAPERRKHRARRLGVAKRHVGAGQDDDAFEGLRLAAVEGCTTVCGDRVLAVERALAVLAQGVGARPVRQHLCGMRQSRRSARVAAISAIAQARIWRSRHWPAGCRGWRAPRRYRRRQRVEAAFQQ